MFKQKNFFLLFKRGLNILLPYQKNAHIKKMVECPAVVPVALQSAVRWHRPKCRCAHKKTVECPPVVPVALSTMVRCAKRHITHLCHLLMSVNIGKHGIERKPCDACQHFIQIDRMANKTQHFVRCVHYIDAFEKGVPGAHEAVDVRGEKNTMESHLCQCKLYQNARHANV